MKFVTCIVVLVLSAACAMGQGFVGESKLPVVAVDGFYRISISPALGGYVNSAFSNIRIHDAKHAEVPYILQAEEPSHFTETFKQYTIVEKKQVKNCCTTIILANSEGRAINNITLNIKNADVTKLARVLGSDDQQTWYALKDQFTISAISNQNSTSEIKLLDFPLSNYSFYKLEITDSLSAPLNIIAAGYYEMISEDGKFSELDVEVASKNYSSTKETKLSIQFDTARVVDRLSIAMKGAPYFLRNAHLYIRQKRKKGKSEHEEYYQYLQSFVISSKQNSMLELNTLFGKELQIVIDNKDNQPLQVSNVKAYQLNRYVTAWLKAGDTYTLKVGQKELGNPVYDIEYFQDKIPSDITTLEVSPLSIMPTDAGTTSTTFFSSPVFVWVAIGLVIAILGFMAIKMARETAGTKQE